MATIDLNTWLTDTTYIVGTPQYDDVSGNITIPIQTGLATDENAIKDLILGIEASAQSKRTEKNSPISEKSFPDDPPYAFVNRVDANGENPELQVEYFPQISLWLKASDVTTADAVNDND